MAVTSKFIANWDSFYDAVQKAEVSLKSFEGSSGKVESALSRVGNSFSGQKVIQDATLMAKIFEDMGGSASFTEKELARMNATATEAAAKLKAMGQEVPAGIQRIATETTGATKETEGWSSSVKQLAIGFAGMFTARAAFNFVNQTVQEASALKDLSQQTHINVEELQILAGAMSEFGVDADTLGKGLFTLSRKIAGDDASVQKALAKMGMSLEQLKGMEGEELFLEIERGLAKLQGGLRDDVAAEIFGSKLGMAMAGASEGIEETMATWRELNTVMSEESVDALDKYDESLKRAQKSISAMAANALGPLAEGFNYLNDAVNKGAGYWDFLSASLKDSFEATFHLGTGTEHLAKLMDDLNQKSDAQKKALRESTEVTLEQTESVSAVARAWNSAAEAADAAANSSRIFGDGLPTEEVKEHTKAVQESAKAEEVFKTNVKFTSEALGEKVDYLKQIKEASEAAKQANDDFMNAPTLNDREATSVSGGIPKLTGFALEDVKMRFHQAGEAPGSEKALWRALDTLESMEGKYRPTDNASFFAMQRDVLLLAQLRSFLEGKERPPGFAGGIENFGGGLAYVHRDEMLVNLPAGTDVIPAGGRGVTNNITLNLSGVIGSRQEIGNYLSELLVDRFRSFGYRGPVPFGA